MPRLVLVTIVYRKNVPLVPLTQGSGMAEAIQVGTNGLQVGTNELQVGTPEV
jgi:hypothetical protein